MGMGSDGSRSVWEWVGMDRCGNGRDGTEIPSPCRPLVQTEQNYTKNIEHVSRVIRRSVPVKPTLFLQLSQRFFFSLSLLANEQSSRDMSVRAAVTPSAHSRSSSSPSRLSAVTKRPVRRSRAADRA